MSSAMTLSDMLKNVKKGKLLYKIRIIFENELKTVPHL